MANNTDRNRLNKEYLFEIIFNGRLIEGKEEKMEFFTKVLDYILNLLPADCDYRLINTVKVYVSILVRTVIPSDIVEQIEQIDSIIRLAWRLNSNLKNEKTRI